QYINAAEKTPGVKVYRLFYLNYNIYRRLSMSLSRNLKQRLAVATVGIPLVIAAIRGGGMAYFVCFLVLADATLHEFYGLSTLAGVRPYTFWGTLMGQLLYALLFLQEATTLPTRYIWGLLGGIPITYGLVLH